jgi:hypothetical protein
MAFLPALVIGAILVASLRRANGLDPGFFLAIALFGFLVAVPIGMFRHWKELHW